MISLFFQLFQFQIDKFLKWLFSKRSFTLSRIFTKETTRYVRQERQKEIVEGKHEGREQSAIERQKEALGIQQGKRLGGKVRGGRLIVLALALAEHIDEVTLPTRPSYAKWTLQTGRPLNLICTSSQLPVKPRPAGSRAESLPRTLTAVCLFTDRFPSRVPFPMTNFSLTRSVRPRWSPCSLDVFGQQRRFIYRYRIIAAGFISEFRKGKYLSGFENFLSFPIKMNIISTLRVRTICNFVKNNAICYQSIYCI